MSNKVYILGHDKPDVDSILSGTVLSEYLNYLNIDSEFIIPENKIDEDSVSALKELNINPQIYMKELPLDANVILVDHHETKHSKNILAIIDHHPTSKKFDHLNYYINLKYNSTTKLVYDIIKERNPEFISKKIEFLTLIATFVDTVSFRSIRANNNDIEWAHNICEKLNIKFKDMEKIGYCLTDLSNLNIAYSNGSKDFKYKDIKVKTSYIKIEKEDTFLENEIVFHIYEILNKSNYNMWVFLICNIKDKNTKEYRIFKDRIERTNYDFIASRGSYIMPQLENDILNKKIEV